MYMHRAITYSILEKVSPCRLRCLIDRLLTFTIHQNQIRQQHKDLKKKQLVTQAAREKNPQYIVTFYNRKLFMHAQIILFLRKKDFVPWINNYRFRNHYIMFRFSTCLIMWGCLCHVTFEQLILKQVQEKSGLEKKKKWKKKICYVFYVKRLQNCHRTHAWGRDRPPPP